jgi:hypothetical protein
MNLILQIYQIEGVKMKTLLHYISYRKYRNFRVMAIINLKKYS